MQKAIITQIDAATGIPATEAPMQNGGRLPDGALVLLALQSEWPTNAPRYIAEVPDAGALGVIELLTDDEAESRITSELAARVEALRARKLHSARQRCDSAMTELENGYPQSEIKSWAKQEAEALAIMGQSGAPTPLLAAIAAERGIALDDLAARVLAKVGVFASAAGQIIGQRQAAEDAIMAATTAAELEAIEC